MKRLIFHLSSITASLQSRRLLLLPLLFASLVASGQAFKAGYIKHQDGRVEYGYVQVTPPDLPIQICYFKPNVNDIAQEFLPSQISGFAFLPGISYQALLTKAVNGKADLFATTIYTGKSNVYKSGNRMLILNGDVLQEVTEEDYRQTIPKVFNDCPYIEERLIESKFNQAELIYLAKSYDRCTNQKQPSKFHGTKLESAITIYAGYDQGTSSFTNVAGMTGLGGRSATNSSPYRIGAQVQLTYPGLSPYVSLISGIAYRPQHYSVAYTDAGSIAAYEFTYSTIDILVPVGLQILMIKRDNFSFFVSGGTMIILPRQFACHQLLDTRTSVGIYQDESTPATGVTGTAANFAGLGATIRMKQKHRAFFNLQYQTGSATLVDQTVTRARIQASGVSFFIGLTF